MIACVVIQVISFDFKYSSIAIAFVLGGFLAKYPDTDNDQGSVANDVLGGHRSWFSHSGIPHLFFMLPMWWSGPSAKAAAIATGHWGLKFIFNIGIQMVALWALATATHLWADMKTKKNYKTWRFVYWFCWGAFLAVASVASIVYLVI